MILGHIERVATIFGWFRWLAEGKNIVSPHHYQYYAALAKYKHIATPLYCPVVFMLHHFKAYHLSERHNKQFDTSHGHI